MYVRMFSVYSLQISRSRSDNVPKAVCVFMRSRSNFVKFVAFEAFEERCFKGVSMVFQERFKKLLRKFLGSLKEVLRKFQGCFKEVLGMF